MENAEAVKQKMQHCFSAWVDRHKIRIEISLDCLEYGIETIEAYLTGTDLLTGEEIGKYSQYVKLSSTKRTALISDPPSCDQVYVHFDAVRVGGAVFRDLVDPIPLALNNDKNGPYIRYSLEKVPGGFTRLTVNSNCPRRCRGNLWLHYSNVCCPAPDMRAQNMVCYIPYTGEIRLASVGNLPTPEKTAK